MLLTGRIPKHIGIIMDGNGRWASSRGLPRIEGHRRGVERTKEVIEVSAEIGLKALTLFAFSTENWRRPSSEVTTLMKLLELYLKKETGNLMKHGIVFKTIGDLQKLPEDLQSVIRDTEEKTSCNKGMVLVAAWSYSGRNEILRAVKKMLSSGIASEELTEDMFASYLDTSGLPDPDLIIRTSGEMRISNFLLWQSAYSEFYFTDTLWPDFSKDEFHLAIQDYQGRERRFGAVPLRADAP
jgi:undecaprenyl diphosphate synthase